MRQSRYVTEKALAVLPSITTDTDFETHKLERLRIIYRLGGNETPCSDYSAVPQERDAYNNRPAVSRNSRYQFIYELIAIAGHLKTLATQQRLPTAVTGINVFITRMIGDINYFEQDTRYYETIKAMLEQIAIKLETLLADGKTVSANFYLKEIGEALTVCAAGLFTRLQDVDYAINNQVSPEICIANLKKTIVHQIADNHIQRHRIPEGNSVHVHSSLKKFAHENGFLLPDGVQFLTLNDQFEGVAMLTQVRKKQCLEEMFAQFTREAIAEEVTVYYQNLFQSFEHKKAALSAEISNLEDELQELREAKATDEKKMATLDTRLKKTRENLQHLTEEKEFKEETAEHNNVLYPDRAEAFHTLCAPFTTAGIFRMDDITVFSGYEHGYLCADMRDRLHQYVTELLIKQGYVISPLMAAIKDIYTGNENHETIRQAYTRASSHRTKLGLIEQLEQELKRIHDLGSKNLSEEEPSLSSLKRMEAAIYAMERLVQQLDATRRSWGLLRSPPSALESILQKRISTLKKTPGIDLSRLAESHAAAIRQYEAELLEQKTAAIRIQSLARKRQAIQALQALKRERATRTKAAALVIDQKLYAAQPRAKAIRYCEALALSHAEAKSEATQRAYAIAFGQDILGLPYTQFGEGPGVAIGNVAFTFNTLAPHICTLTPGNFLCLTTSALQMADETGITLHPETQEILSREFLPEESVDIDSLNFFINLRRLQQLCEAGTLHIPKSFARPTPLKNLAQLPPDYLTSKTLHWIFEHITPEKLDQSFVNDVHHLHQFFEGGHRNAVLHCLLQNPPIQTDKLQELSTHYSTINQYLLQNTRYTSWYSAGRIEILIALFSNNECPDSIFDITPLLEQLKKFSSLHAVATLLKHEHFKCRDIFFSIARQGESAVSLLGDLICAIDQDPSTKQSTYDRIKILISNEVPIHTLLLLHSLNRLHIETEFTAQRIDALKRINFEKDSIEKVMQIFNSGEEEKRSLTIRGNR